MRAPRALAAGVLLAVLLGGCTGGGDEPDPTETTSGTDGGGGEQTPSGPTPEELSAQVLDAAAEQAEAQPLASGSGTSAGGNQVTIDVLAVERVEGATLVRMRVSGSEGALGPSDFRGARYDGIVFARTLYLVDPTVTATRYLPLQFDDYREACACPYFPLANGSEAQVVTALYPELPAEVTTVDLDANGFLSVTGIPVGS